MGQGSEQKLNIADVIEAIWQTRIMLSDVTKQLEQMALVLAGVESWVREIHGLEKKVDDDTLPQ